MPTALNLGVAQMRQSRAMNQSHQGRTVFLVNMIRFISYERVDKVWCMQEWYCEIDRSK